MEKEIINKWQIESSLLHFISNILFHYNPKNIIEIGDFAEQVLNYCLFTNDKKFLKTPTTNNLLERNRFYEEFDALPNRSAIVEIMPLENQTFKIDSDLISNTLKSLENDGILCLLVPSKFLTFPEYSDFRKLIIDNYSIDIVIDFATISKVTSVRTTLLVVRNGVKNDLKKLGYKDAFVVVYKDGQKLSVNEAITKSEIVRGYPGQYSALNILYFSCDDIANKLDAINDSIITEWQK